MDLGREEEVEETRKRGPRKMQHCGQDPECLDSTASEVLDSSTLKDIDEGVKNLKKAVIGKLEEIFKSPPVSSSNERVDNQAESRVSVCKNEGNGSLRELAKSYLKERKSVLDMVRSKVASDEGGNNTGDKVNVQTQISIWTEIATDLDTYYLTELNKNLRTEKLNVEEINDCSLLTYRVSESVVDDIKRSKNRQTFSSRWDINDDVKFGQLQDSFESSENSINNLVENLLSRTNRRRKVAIAYDEKEAGRAALANENREYNGGDEYWSSSDSEASLLEDEITNMSTSVASYLKRCLKEKEDEAEQNRQEVERQRAYITEQHEELNNRMGIIDKLKIENTEIIKALETFELYRLHCGKQSAYELAEMKKCYDAKLEEKSSKIQRLKQEIKVRPRIKDEVREALVEISRDFAAGTGVNEADENIYVSNNERGLDESASDSLNKGIEVCVKTELEHESANQRRKTEIETVPDMTANKKSENEFLIRMADNLSHVLTTTGSPECEADSLHSTKPSRASFENLLGKFVKTFQTTCEDNKIKKREIELVQRGVEISEFESFKKRFGETRRKTHKIAAKNRDLELLIAKKDSDMENQKDSLAKCQDEMSCSLSRIPDLEAKLECALSGLAAAQDDAKVAREELRILAEIDQERANEHEKLVQFILDDLCVIKTAPKQAISKSLVKYFQRERGYCNRCNEGRAFYLQDMQ